MAQTEQGAIGAVSSADVGPYEVGASIVRIDCRLRRFFDTCWRRWRGIFLGNPLSRNVCLTLLSLPPGMPQALDQGFGTPNSASFLSRASILLFLSCKVLGFRGKVVNCATGWALVRILG